MDWTPLQNVLVLLTAALVLGAVCERLRQSAIVGYLIAGLALGPNALRIISDENAVNMLAELGVALLLFSIGLEFSWNRLKRMGLTAIGGGTAQVILTGAAVYGICRIAGLSVQTSIAIGAIIAPSSTACVLRLLMNRAETDSVHGRHCIGILLLQDIAIVPLMLIVTALGGSQSGGDIVVTIFMSLGTTIALFTGLFLLLKYLVPLVLHTQPMQQSRELPILLAIVVGLGSAWAAHEFHVSPALGAFAAGMILAESPFATQIRADVGSLRTLLMTLFFSSIGMVGDVSWIASNWPAVVLLVIAVLAGKTLIIGGILRFFAVVPRHALAAGICLAQIGEFSFVLAAVAHQSIDESPTVLSDYHFNLIVSATILTMLLSPYLVAAGPTIGLFSWRLLHRIGGTVVLEDLNETTASRREGHIVIVGYGPAGQEIARTMAGRTRHLTIIDLNAKAISGARREGFEGIVGDATSADVLEHAHIAQAAAAVLTIPTPTIARASAQLIRSLAPNVHLIVRSRYHIHRWELEMAGAHVVIDEERHVGLRLAAELRKHLRKSPSAERHATESVP